MAKTIVFSDNESELEVSLSRTRVSITCISRNPEEMMLQRTVALDKTDIGELIETLKELHSKIE
jgi:hypothetical protein